MAVNLVDFSADEKAMVIAALEVLAKAGYDTDVFDELIRVDMPPPYRAMTLAQGAALGTSAFESAEMLNHVLEEEYLHLKQKASMRTISFCSSVMEPETSIM